MKRRDLPLLLAGVLLVVLAHMYFWRADWYAVLTIWPVWVWLLPMFFLVRLGWQRSRRWWGWALVGVAVAGALAVMEEPRSLLRTSRGPGTIRVVSLNCAGNDDAAREVVADNPDIVLLQESPSQPALAALARALHGTLIYTPDRSLIARGEVTRVPLPITVRAVRATVRLPGKFSGEVVCLRLSPHPLGANFWSPELWRLHAAAMREQREELRAVVSGLPADAPLIVGGDFNAPVRDPVYHAMPAGLRDSFREAGIGWGDTLLNVFPIWRIDQVWISRHFRATAVVARKTIYSDHRRVVCELTFPPE